MKKYFTNISVSILLLFILSLVFALIFTLLSHNGVISTSLNETLIMITSFITFFLFGLLFGKKSQKKGLLNGIVLAGIYGLVLLMYYLLENKTWDLNTTIINISRILLIVIGSVIGVNLNKKLEQ